MKKIVGIILALTLLFCAVPLGSVKTNALSGSTYTDNKTLAARFDTLVTNYVPGSSFYTKNGKACSCHANSSINCIAATHPNCNCLRVIQYNGKSIDLGTVQCFGYARYCQQILYGVNEYTNPDKFEKIAGPGSVTATTLKNWFVTNKDKFQMGTHIRLHKGRHSVSIVKVDYTAGKIIYLEANWTSQSSNSGNWCKVNALRTSTWSEFASKYSSYMNYAMVLKDFSAMFPDTPVMPDGVYKTNAALTLRNGASDSNAAVSSLAQNTEVEVVNRNADYTWAYCKVGTTYGWCRFSLLTFVRDFRFTIVFDMQGNGTDYKKICALNEAFAPPVSPASLDGRTVAGWTVTRVSDGAFLTTSGAWAATGTKIVFKEGTALAIAPSHRNINVGDDTFRFSPEWNGSVSTKSTAEPYKYGWYWDEKEAYGYIGGYGKNAQDICFTADICLLPAANDSTARFYTEDGSGMTVGKNSVSVGSSVTAYNWGELSWDNWHRVQFVIKNGMGAVYIDGTLIARQTSGITAYTGYQLLFSQTGSMAIDNASLKDSSGSVTYFECDFENEAAAKKIFNADGEGLGKRVYLSVSTNPPEEPPVPQYKKGDLDSDDHITVKDVLIMKNAVLGNAQVSLNVGDINGDGKVNTVDYNMLKQIFLGC